MKLLTVFSFLTAAIWAQPVDLHVVDVTPTEATIRYIAPGSAACGLEVSTLSDYSVVVNDVNAAYFANSNSDLLRSDTVVEGRRRTVVIGKTGRYYRDANGVNRSRALQADTQHYVRVTCGSPATTTIITANIPLGQVASTQVLPVESPFRYAVPSLNPLFQTSFVDSATGVLIHEYPNFAGVAYAGTTGATGRTFGCAENITSGWTASDSGTLVNALSANDSVYAQTTTSGAQLFAGLCDTNYSKYPNNGTYSTNQLSYQNVKLRIDCNGSGCGAGKTVKIALTTDRGTVIQTKTITATTSEQQIVICHTAPCTVQANPGDAWSPDLIPRDRYSLGLGLVYNSSADYTILKFLVQADCDALRAGDQLVWWDDSHTSSYSPHITSTSCGSSPPQVSLDSSAKADGNGTGGIPFTFASGIANNSRYGFLIWSDDDLTNATIRVDEGLWRAASYIGGVNEGVLAVGSGGFNKRCQKPKTTNGFTLCAAGSLLYAIKAQSDGTMDMRFLGIAYLRADVAGITGATSDGLFFDHGTTDFHWDDTTAGVFYEVFSMTATSPASGTQAFGVAKFVLAHPETACGQAGTACPAADPDGGDIGGRWPVPDISSANSKALTACLNSCMSAATDDYTIAGQALRINAQLSDPELGFARFHPGAMAISAIQDGYAKINVIEGSQDSFAQTYMFDIGNGSPIGGGYTPVHGGTYAAQQIFAFNPVYATIGGRWGDNHTDQPVLYSHAYTVMEIGEKVPYEFTITTNMPACSKTAGGVGNCAACPSIIVDGVNYTGKNICLHATLTSSWNGAWEGQPNAFGHFTAGDPVNTLSPSSANNNFHWLQHTAVGDIVAKRSGLGFEALKLIQRTSASDVYFERGCNSNDDIDGTPKNWGTNSVWDTLSNSYNPVCAQARTEVGSGGQQWDFVGDPLAADTAWTPFQNHGWNVCPASGGIRSYPDYFVQLVDCTNWTAVKAVTQQSIIRLPETFAGVGAEANGNSTEKHPGMVNSASSTAVNRTWFMDSNPLEYYAPSTSVHTHVSGSLYKLNCGPGFTCNPKQFPIGAFSGQPPYLNVSAPGVTLATTTADRGKFCIAVLANDCASGSSPGDIYANGPLDPLQLGCRGIEFYFGEIDTCVGNTALFSASDNQWLLPTNNTSTLTINQSRPISKHLAYRFSGTDNVKTNPDGDYLFYRNDPWYAKIPTLPGAESLNLTTFVSQMVTVGTAPRGTSRLMVKFGYDENFHCSDNRAEACYAVSSTLNESTPFLWASELGSTSGVPCSVGCSVTIPVIPGRTLRYQLVYRDAGGVNVYASPTQFR